MSVVVEYRDHMGDDLRVVDAARASFGKRSQRLPDGSLKPADVGLIHFLARGLSSGDYAAMLQRIVECGDLEAAEDLFSVIRSINTHFAPFGHPQLYLQVEAPLFVARQLWKSHIGAAGGDAGTPMWSEESRRYLDGTPEVFRPEEWRGRAENVKQGSAGPAQEQGDISFRADLSVERSLTDYRILVDRYRVAPEQARMVLPQSIMVSWAWTGSLLFFYRVCRLRLDSHAQAETRAVAERIAGICEPIAPVSWAALQGS